CYPQSCQSLSVLTCASRHPPSTLPSTGSFQSLVRNSVVLMHRDCQRGSCSAVLVGCVQCVGGSLSRRNCCAGSPHSSYSGRQHVIGRAACLPAQDHLCSRADRH